jgi:hypothetical protein
MSDTPTRSRQQQSRARSRSNRPPQRSQRGRGSESKLVATAQIVLGASLSCMLGGLILLALLGVVGLAYYLIG